jgi:Domain of unknown function (DUF5679)
MNVLSNIATIGPPYQRASQNSATKPRVGYRLKGNSAGNWKGPRMVVRSQRSGKRAGGAATRNLLSSGNIYLRRSVKMATATSTGYCMKRRAPREIKDPKPITMKNGRPATEGSCQICATKISQDRRCQVGIRGLSGVTAPA